MLFTAIISIICMLPTFGLVLRYNLHMFQLNGYKNKEHITWLGKNKGKQGLLVPVGIAGIVALIFPSIWTLAAQIIIWLIVCRYYIYLKKANTKKNLVFTKRVQRQIVTDVIINIIVLLLVGIVGQLRFISGTCGILVALQGVLLLVINIINKPIETSINHYYINDAKKKLKQVPNLKIIGVTGSYGKTSVKYYLYTLLREHFNVLITPESYNTPMGVVKTIRESLKPTHEIFVCEMGARHVGDIKEICDIVHPQHGVITSIGAQHIETFFNIENIVKTKFELADALSSDGLLFLNGDNVYIMEHAHKYNNKIFYSGSNDKADTFADNSKKMNISDDNRNKQEVSGYFAEDIKLSQVGTEFTVVAPNGEKERFQMRLVGQHNIVNVVGAIAVANRFGVSLSNLKAAVRRIQPVAHRMQMTQHGNVTIIDDAYNSNPVGSKAAVETLAMFDGVRILITPGMVELGKDEEKYNYKLGMYAAKCCDYILLVGKKHTQPIQNGAIESGFPKEKCIAYDKLEEALRYAYSINEEGHKYILLENDLPDNY